MGRRQKTLINLENDCILHIPYTLSGLLRSCIETKPIDFEQLSGYSSSNNEMFFLNDEKKEIPETMETLEDKISGFDILRDLKKGWVEKTNVLCWWCIHPFDTIPLGIPVSRNNDIFKVKGCFCSFNCIMAYHEEECQKYKKNDETIYLTQCLYRTLTGKIMTNEIIKAPPREMLKVLGGNYSIKEFRDKFNTFGGLRTISYKKFEPPMVSLNIQVEEVIKTSPVIKRDGDSLDDRVSKASKSIENTADNNVIPDVKNFTKTKLSDFFKI